MMKNTRNLLACDLGASGGRAMLGRFDGSRLQAQEIHRFANEPVNLGGTFYWDFLRLFHEVKASLVKAKLFGATASIAVDTWGVDFGLLDDRGRLLENPVHYRDSRTHGMLAKALQRISREKLYEITGNQFMEINTAFQLLSLRESRDRLLQQAGSLLMLPDLFHFFLCGQRVSECSIASTSQLFDIHKKDWAWDVIGALGLPDRLFEPVAPSGTVLGELFPSIQDDLDIPPAQVIAVAGHDTQSALAATPAAEKDFIFLSSGTWSLLGTELAKPLTGKDSLACNLTNECAYAGNVSFLKNITGLWLQQESRRHWARRGTEYSYDQLEELARSTPPLRSFVNPDDPSFTAAGNMPRRIREYCQRTGQPVPESDGELVRCIKESLAMAYRQAVEEIQACTGRYYPAIYVLGGGSRDDLLCEMTASACGRPVYAGPAEATVLGNLAVQLIALGELHGLDEARELIRRSEPVRIFEPQDLATWEEAYARYRKITGESALYDKESSPQR